ncbi:MAG: DUF4783 domain-containing protein [Ferruginibacter sp.]
MKRIFTILAIGFVLTSFSTFTSLSEVITAIKAGNAAGVAKYFDNTVEITLAGKSNSYSKSQGEAVLRDFFANNNVKSFAIVHQGESSGSQFCIGTLTTVNGSYRTTLNLRQKADKQSLQEIKFEK